MPVLVAPMAMQRLCHPEGELAMARAAADAGVPMVVSTMATASLAEVAATGAPLLWFQVYVLTRRDLTRRMIERAVAAGYKAIVVTVDAPRLGRREGDQRHRFALPPGLALANLEEEVQGEEEDAGKGKNEEGTPPGPPGGSGGGGCRPFARRFTSLIDASLTFEVIPWIKSFCPLPVLVKGILAPDDARRAVARGADGVIVSNHGGRQLDGAPAALDVLPAVAAAVAGRAPVLVDGGVRRGTDVLKCLAQGAAAVLVGRPLLWALAVEGRRGVGAALGALREEVELGMALLGAASVGEVTPEVLLRPGAPSFRIPASRL
jgi:isopentenyl diphosphate isomerase/L-lactate dehydrogenase-like FMN-dependent dehydrogenase